MKWGHIGYKGQGGLARSRVQDPPYDIGGRQPPSR